MIRNFTLTNALGASFSLMNSQQGAFFEPQGLGFDDATQYEQVGEFFAPLTQRYGQQVITGSMVFGSQPYEHYLTFTKFCQHAPLSLVYETDAGTFQIPCRLTKIEKGDTDGWTYLNCKVEFTALARMYKTVVANNTGTAGGGKVYLAKDLPDITGSIITIDNAEVGEVLNITADIDPIQDLHGYDAPWVGGAGKNKLNASSGSGTVSGVTFTNTNGVIVASGSATANVYRVVGTFTPENGVEYILTGCPSGGANGKYRITLAGYGYEFGNGYTFTGDGQSHNISCDVYSGYPTSGTTLTFKPMIRLSSESDATWQPYENICPISGHTEVDAYVSGVNLITSDNTEDGSINASGVESATAGFKRTKLIPVGNTIAVNFAIGTGYTIRLHGYDSSGTWVRQIKDYYNVGADHDVVSIPSGISYVRLSFPAVATDVAIENATTYTTALGRTVYGGTLDMVSGVLTVTHGIVDLGTLNWTYENSGSYTRFFSTGLNSIVKKPSSDYETVDMKCSALKTTNTSAIWKGTEDGIIAFGATGALNARIKAYTTAAAFKTSVSGYMLVYPLATPQTYQLTPQQIQTILGTNNVWANSGDITITGRKTYGYKYNYTYGNFVADTVTIDSDSATSSPCRITIFGECTQPTWRHYLDGNSVATGYYNGTIPSGHKLVIDTTSSPYSIEEQDIAGNLIADRYELCDFSTERFFLLEYGHNTISVSHTDPDSIRLMVEGFIFYETV